MSTEQIDPLRYALEVAGIGAETLRRTLVAEQAKLAARDTRAERTIDRLDRMTHALWNLAEELTERGGKVNAQKLARKIVAIRNGGTYGDDQ